VWLIRDVNVTVGLFLDVKSCSTGKRGRFSTDAECDRSSGRRQSSPDRQHVHLAALHPSLLVKTDPSTETSSCSQDQELRLRVDRDVFTVVSLDICWTWTQEFRLRVDRDVFTVASLDICWTWTQHSQHGTLNLL